MFDINNIQPTPTDMATRREFTGCLVPLPLLIEAANDINQGIAGRVFKDCVVRGPAVIVPNRGTQIKDCDLGDVGGDPRNLFLIPAGPMTMGSISVADCVFDGCLFSGVAMAGDAEFVEAFIARLVSQKRPV